MVSHDTEDAPIPGQPYSFGSFKRAQALGDLEALRKHGRRVMRIMLSADAAGQLSELTKSLGIHDRDQHQKRAA
jgi:hypothetical protein